MKEKLNNVRPELTDDQAIDALYAMFNEKRTPLDVQKVGRYGFINPGPKDMRNLLLKIDRKTRSLDDAHQNLPMANVIDKHYNGRPGDLLDQLTDWARFAIIIPDFQAAPATVAYFLGEFGGKISYHNNDDYQAIHQHTTYKDVNLEFQFHTMKNAELKKITDIFYHKYNNIQIPKNSEIEQTYQDERADMIEHCQTVYSHSGFAEAMPAVENAVEAYSQRTQNQIANKSKLRHFCMYVRKAELVQQELARTLPKHLEILNQIDRTTLLSGDDAKTKN